MNNVNFYKLTSQRKLSSKFFSDVDFTHPDFKCRFHPILYKTYVEKHILIIVFVL